VAALLPVGCLPERQISTKLQVIALYTHWLALARHCVFLRHKSQFVYDNTAAGNILFQHPLDTTFVAIQRALTTKRRSY
jgi:hypothetical protein